jgi:DNA-binding XRE family transcriptional regulator
MPDDPTRRLLFALSGYIAQYRSHAPVVFANSDAVVEYGENNLGMSAMSHLRRVIAKPRHRKNNAVPDLDPGMRRLHQVFVDSHMTEERFAEEMGVSRQTLIKYFQGKSWPRRGTIEHIRVRTKAYGKEVRLRARTR